MTTTLMDNGQIEVWATDVDHGSADNCTAAEQLKYGIWHASLGEAPTHIASIHALPERITFDCNSSFAVYKSLIISNLRL